MLPDDELPATVGALEGLACVLFCLCWLAADELRRRAWRALAGLRA